MNYICRKRTQRQVIYMPKLFLKKTLKTIFHFFMMAHVSTICYPRNNERKNEVDGRYQGEFVTWFVTNVFKTSSK